MNVIFFYNYNFFFFFFNKIINIIILIVKNKIISISTGYNHSLFLDENGILYGCGEGDKICQEEEDLIDKITKIDPKLCKKKKKKILFLFINIFFF